MKTTEQVLTTQYETSRQLAERLGVCHRTIQVWQSKGILPFLKLGKVVRFIPAQVDAALAQRFAIKAR